MKTRTKLFSCIAAAYDKYYASRACGEYGNFESNLKVSQDVSFSALQCSHDSDYNYVNMILIKFV